MKKWQSVIAIILSIALFSALAIGSGSGSSSSSYSDEYNNNPNYRKNVDDIAGAYGEDSNHVDSVLNKMAEELN